MYFFSFLFVLSVVVIVHEYGHFKAARLCGVRVLEFSMGFGKILWSKRDKYGTEIKVCCIPFGGYVRMFGDADPTSSKEDQNLENLSEEEKKEAFPFQKLWKRAVIVFAGPLMNYILGIVLLTGLFRFCGMLEVPPVISAVQPASVAEKSGLKVDDRFLQINDIPVNSFSDIQRIILVEDDLNILVLRNGENVNIKAHLERKKGEAVLGIQATLEREHVRDLNLWEAFKLALNDVWDLTVDTTKVLSKICSGKRSTKELRGPLGIAEASGDAAKGGMISLISFIVQVSVGIGFLNLLPIPVLDGGHLFFYFIELIFRKPPNEVIKNIAANVGLFLLLLLLILTSWNDIVRMFARFME
ncbi:MAG: RIP metalloprotease RseP [Alphaproteobacteria bacterium]|nr:RIP metalloprotease RseP [Alphaproteobacteria bacterium]